MTRLILLDRDGVINVDSPQYIKSPSEWVPLPGALSAIGKLTMMRDCVARSSPCDQVTASRNRLATVL